MSMSLIDHLERVPYANNKDPWVLIHGPRSVQRMWRCAVP